MDYVRQEILQILNLKEADDMKFLETLLYALLKK